MNRDYVDAWGNLVKAEKPPKVNKKERGSIVIEFDVDNNQFRSNNPAEEINEYCRETKLPLPDKYERTMAAGNNTAVIYQTVYGLKTTLIMVKMRFG